MIVYGSSLSPFVRKVLAYAGEKGIDIDVQPVEFRSPSPDFMEASPFRRMPALRDGDFTLADSTAIIHYLEAKHPTPALIPAEARPRGKVVWFDEFADTILVGCGRKIFFNRIVAPRFLNRPGNEEEVQQAELNDLPPILEYLEKTVPRDDGYLVGEALTLADLAVASPFANFRHTKTNVDPARYPRTVAYVDRILARPSFAPWIEREVAMLAAQPA